MKNLERVTRKFPGKASEMFAGIAAIIDSARDHVQVLAEEDTSITELRLGDLRRRIETASADILGADNAAGLRHANEAVRRSTAEAVDELVLLKTFIETHFGPQDVRRRELLQNLGITELFRSAVSRRQHEDMVELLARVAANLNGQVEAALIGSGLPVKRIETLRKLAAAYAGHNADRQGQRGRQRQYNAADMTVANDLYTEVMAIAKTAKACFKNEPVIRGRFMYSRVTPGRGQKNDTTPGTAGNTAA